jgi:antitoxin CptB
MSTIAPGGDDLALRRKKALYRAQHRGTKEMDWLLGRFAVAHLASMNAAELKLFEQFLAIADPELNHWLLEPNMCEHQDFAALIADLRAFHGLT